MSTPRPVLGLVSLYLVIVIFGPRLMMNREAFHINWLLVVYNFGLVLLSFYMFSEVGAACQIKFTTVQELDRNVTLSQNISCLAWRPIVRNWASLTEGGGVKRLIAEPRRRSGAWVTNSVSPGRGLLIPLGYLHWGKCEHSGTE